jgi:uncharacterized membrane protein
MKRGRLEAFSDGVLAVAITIMVLEMKVPQGADWSALSQLWPVFLSYVLSFVYIGIYWNNHHHLLSTCDRVDGSIMWANLHLLFWLTLVPFVTGWMGENEFAPIPTTLYGVVLILSALAFLILQTRIVAAQSPESALRRELGSDLKGRLSPALYLAGIFIAQYAPMIAFGLYGAVAIVWLVPDKRIERAVRESEQSET